MTSYLYIFLSSWKIVSHTALLPPLIPLGCGTFFARRTEVGSIDLWTFDGTFAEVTNSGDVDFDGTN
jgi:hypothetical protein